MKKGSITVFLAFILSLLTALVCTQLSSVKQAASRAQIAGAADIGLYSLFAQYDKDLLEQFEIFGLDGCFGGEALDLGKVYDVIGRYMEPVLEQNFTELKLKGGGFTGYELATDDGGLPFYHQAAEAEKFLLGEQGIQLLLSKTEEQKEHAVWQERMQEDKEREEILQQYDREIEADKENAQGPEGFQTEIQEQPTPVPVENPIEVIRRIQKMGLLELVLQNSREVSTKEADTKTFVSKRKCEVGMSMETAPIKVGGTEDFLYQEYILSKCGNYLSPGEGSLSYQAEYILYGKDSDISNLKKTVNRLLLLREGANLIHLYSDPGKYGQASTLAATIAASLLLPAAEPVICLAVLSCWAFGESILDVRQLMAGGKVAFVKDPESWQLSLENLPKLLERLDEDRRNQKDGLGYKDYLRILLFMTGREQKISRGMDMVEVGMRAFKNRKSFRLDGCILAAEVTADVEAGGEKIYQITRSYGYGQD
ncbi:MAG: DUF5702 domain-containing protein [Blautia sp.]